MFCGPRLNLRALSTPGERRSQASPFLQSGVEPSSEHFPSLPQRESCMLLPLRSKRMASASLLHRSTDGSLVALLRGATPITDVSTENSNETKTRVVLLSGEKLLPFAFQAIS
jgi:hypothetical protein